jgi:anti-sigma B factor antagonist
VDLPQASVRAEHLESCVVLRIRGEVDLLTADRVRAAIITELKRAPGRVIIDLNEVDFLGSHGLRILLEVRDIHPSFQIACKNRMVLRVLEAVGLRELFAIHGTVTEALQVGDPD